MVVTERSPFQICCHEKMPTCRMEVHSKDVTNPMFIGQTSLACSPAILVAVNMNRHHFLKLKVKEILECPSRIHYLQYKKASDVIWNDGKLVLYGCRISSLGLCFSWRFATQKKLQKNPQPNPKPTNQPKLIQFKVCLQTLCEVCSRFERKQSSYFI